MPTLGAVGLSYWVASLPLGVGNSSVQWLSGPPGNAGSAAAAGSPSDQQPAPSQLAAPSGRSIAGVAGKPGALPDGGDAAGAAGLDGAVSALLPTSSTGDLLAAESVSGAASPERQRQLQDLTVSAPLLSCMQSHGASCMLAQA